MARLLDNCESTTLPMRVTFFDRPTHPHLSVNEQGDCFPLPILSQLYVTLVNFKYVTSVAY